MNIPKAVCLAQNQKLEKFQIYDLTKQMKTQMECTQFQWEISFNW